MATKTARKTKKDLKLIEAEKEPDEEIDEPDEEIDEPDEEIDEPDEDDEPELKEKKAERFFETLPADTEVKVSIYKKNAFKRKWEKCESYFTSDKHVDDEDIRKKWGSGEYQLYAHTFVENKWKMKDSCTFTLAEPLKSEIKEISSPDADKDLDRVIKLAGVLGLNTGKQDNSLMLEFMKLNNMTTTKLGEMIQTISQKMSENQLASERRVFEYMEKEKKKTGLSELLEQIKLIDEIRGTTSGESEKGFMDTIIPMAMPLLQNLISNQNPANISKKISVDEFIAQLPENFKEQITLENSPMIIEKIVEKNPSYSKEFISQVVLKIANSKR